MTLEECEQRLKLARIAETEAERQAVIALSEAMKAKYRRLHAWIEFAMAQGSKESFAKTYQECAALLYRADNKSGHYVSRALSTSIWTGISEMLPK